MAFKIEESFDVKAPIEPVWEFLIDPRRVVVCLPGAELTDVIDERSFGGRVRVKVGPVTVAYKGTMRLEEVTESAHRVRLTGEGKEAGGTGSAKMAMTGVLAEGGVGATRVRVEAEIDVAGKMARFGRAVMEDVSRQLFRDFAASMKETLEQPAGGEPPDAATMREARTDSGALSPGGAGEGASTQVPSDDADAVERPREPSPPGAGAEHASATSNRSPNDSARAKDTAPPVSSRPISAVALAFRVLSSRIKRLFGG